MQAGRQLILNLDIDCETAASLIKELLKSSGYFVFQSFDLHSVINGHQQCLCAEGSCNCQMIILLVYPRSRPPATLILDGGAANTSVALALNTSQPILPYWITRISDLLMQALTSGKFQPKSTE